MLRPLLLACALALMGAKKPKGAKKPEGAKKPVAAKKTVTLTIENWEAETPMKTCFIRFFDPWAPEEEFEGKMWRKLMQEFNGREGYLVTQVECQHNELCSKTGVGKFLKTYPTILYGDARDLKKYTGGHNRLDLKKFMDEHGELPCSVFNAWRCSEEKQNLISELQGLDENGLYAKFLAKEKQLEESKALWAEKIRVAEALVNKTAEDLKRAHTTVEDRDAMYSLMHRVRSYLIWQGTNEAHKPIHHTNRLDWIMEKQKVNMYDAWSHYKEEYNHDLHSHEAQVKMAADKREVPVVNDHTEDL